MTATPERRKIRLGGHDLTVLVTPGEERHLELATHRVNDLMESLQGRAGGLVSPQKVALMAAFQCAFDACKLDAELEQCRRTEVELEDTRAALGRLETLLGKVDDALAY